MKTQIKKLVCSVATALFGWDESGQPVKKTLPYRVTNWPSDLDSAVELFEGPEALLERFLAYEDAHNSKGAARRSYGEITSRHEEIAKHWRNDVLAEGGDIEMAWEETSDWLKIAEADRPKYDTVNLLTRKRELTAEELECLAFCQAKLAEELSLLPADGPEFTMGLTVRISNSVAEAAKKATTAIIAGGQEIYSQVLAKCAERGYVRLERIYPVAPKAHSDSFEQEIARAIAHKERYEAAQKAKDDLSAVLG